MRAWAHLDFTALIGTVDTKAKDTLSFLNANRMLMRYHQNGRAHFQAVK